MRWSRAIAVAIPLAVAMGGCLNTGFVRHDMGTDLEAASSSSWPARRVIYQLDRRLLEDPEAILTWRVIDAGDIFLGVWSERHLHLEVILADAVDAAPLWRARHAGWRADGGLPLSPLSVPVVVANATLHHGDGELNASLIDDVTCRLFSTLPSLR